MGNHTRIVLQAVRMAHNAKYGYDKASYLITVWLLVNAFLYQCFIPYSTGLISIGIPE